ncbi:MAG: aminoacyl-histidine dipeptidase [Clostridia bacterium]|nr:aminoacyl-histidine dipeptidase [Clostridia bacterium]
MTERLAGIKPERVFKYFEEICAVPHGSGNMDAIAEYCMSFAAEHSLEAVRDEANNVVIFKPAASGYENSEPIILQGHLDMVCQKEKGLDFDFESDGIRPYIDGDLIRAEGTTLGADNGIAVAMIFAILEDMNACHPPIEAVLTTDEEIGMIGAEKLCTDIIKGKRMINIDAEDFGTLTVSCAGGSDFRMIIPLKRKKIRARRVEISLKGLRGGHSGIEINSGRVNANILAGRVLNYAKAAANFDIISIDGGDKGNAIPCSCTMQLALHEVGDFAENIEGYLDVIRKEIAEREPEFAASVTLFEESELEVIESPLKDKLIFMLLCAPNGVAEMSAEIENLVETSLNLGILKTEQDKMTALFTLRSNKKSALKFLEDKLFTYAECVDCSIETSGHYQPWEFKENSELQNLYKQTFKEFVGHEPEVVAIHAGLECATFSKKIKDLDCIAIGPDIRDAHTVKESLSIASTEAVYELILRLLKQCR